MACASISVDCRRGGRNVVWRLASWSPGAAFAGAAPAHLPPSTLIGVAAARTDCRRRCTHLGGPGLAMPFANPSRRTTTSAASPTFVTRARRQLLACMALRNAARALTQSGVLPQRRGGDIPGSHGVAAQRNARAGSACRSPEDIVPPRPGSPELRALSPWVECRSPQGGVARRASGPDSRRHARRRPRVGSFGI